MIGLRRSRSSASRLRSSTPCLDAWFRKVWIDSRIRESSDDR
jgi:hypothetical protein